MAFLPVIMLICAGTALAQDNDAATNAKEAAQAAAEVKAEARSRAEVFAKMVAQVRQLGEKEAAIGQRRENAARQKLEEQQRLLRQATARLDAAEKRSHVLDREWKQNDTRIADLSKLLTQQQGNLGELFGVVRKVSADAASALRNSLLTTQYKPPQGQAGRSQFLTRLAKGHAVPSVDELQRLWFELFREIVGSGKVVRYRTDVLQTGQLANGKPENVVRVGPFTVVNGNEYLGYLSSTKSLTELEGKLPEGFRETAYNLTHAAPGAGYTKAVVDVSSGGIIGLYLDRPNWFQRIQLGETVGYLIIALGVLGLLLSVVQFGYLLLTRRAINKQYKNLSQPETNNPLGRLLLTFRGEGKNPKNAEIAELRLSEAVLREIPGLERFQSFLRLVVAAGPLLGLIGTVTGMIITFHAIVASGSSDPTVMANGIGHAMIATVLGLGVAIPLLFIVTGLRAYSGKIIQGLDEFSQSLLAEQLGGEENKAG